MIILILMVCLTWSNLSLSLVDVAPTQLVSVNGTSTIHNRGSYHHQDDLNFSSLTDATNVAVLSSNHFDQPNRTIVIVMNNMTPSLPIHEKTTTAIAVDDDSSQEDNADKMTDANHDLDDDRDPGQNNESRDEIINTNDDTTDMIANSHRRILPFYESSCLMKANRLYVRTLDASYHYKPLLTAVSIAPNHTDPTQAQQLYWLTLNLGVGFKRGKKQKYSLVQLYALEQVDWYCHYTTTGLDSSSSRTTAHKTTLQGIALGGTGCPHGHTLTIACPVSTSSSLPLNYSTSLVLSTSSDHNAEGDDMAKAISASSSSKPLLLQRLTAMPNNRTLLPPLEYNVSDLAECAWEDQTLSSPEILRPFYDRATITTKNSAASADGNVATSFQSETVGSTSSTPEKQSGVTESSPTDLKIACCVLVFGRKGREKVKEFIAYHRIAAGYDHFFINIHEEYNAAMQEQEHVLPLQEPDITYIPANFPLPRGHENHGYMHQQAIENNCLHRARAIGFDFVAMHDLDEFVHLKFVGASPTPTTLKEYLHKHLHEIPGGLLLSSMTYTISPNRTSLLLAANASEISSSSLLLDSVGFDDFPWTGREKMITRPHHALYYSVHQVSGFVGAFVGSTNVSLVMLPKPLVPKLQPNPRTEIRISHFRESGSPRKEDPSMKDQYLEAVLEMMKAMS